MLDRTFFVLVTAAFCLGGCASLSPNTNPNVLAEAPYNQVHYQSTLPKEARVVDTIEVVYKGDRANILSTIPALYKEALSRALKDSRSGTGVGITNIRVTAYTRREVFEVPYQDCQNKTTMENVTKQDCQTRMVSKYVSEQECSGYGSSRSCRYVSRSKMVPQYECKPVTRMENVTKRECKTAYKKEMKDVLYQQVKGDVYVAR